MRAKTIGFLVKTVSEKYNLFVLHSFQLAEKFYYKSITFVVEIEIFQNQSFVKKKLMEYTSQARINIILEIEILYSLRHTLLCKICNMPITVNKIATYIFRERDFV